MKRALQIILAISVFGSLFSGVLTYHELFGVFRHGLSSAGCTRYGVRAIRRVYTGSSCISPSQVSQG